MCRDRQVRQMKPGHGCLSCLVRQASEAARVVSGDEKRLNLIMKEVLLSLYEADLSLPPPNLSQLVHRAVRQAASDSDPYREHKRRFNDLALSILPEIESMINNSDDPFGAAVRVSIAGNVIDMGISGDLSENDIIQAMDRIMKETFRGSIPELRKRLNTASNVLFIADNAGEIVFDSLLIERLGVDDVTVAVRGAPILNDATEEDARIAGIHRIAKTINNGSDAPGTILEDCSAQFMNVFDKADVIIAKGQGNFESLCDVKRDIFFLLKIKCDYLANRCGFNIGTHTIIRTCRP